MAWTRIDCGLRVELCVLGVVWHRGSTVACHFLHLFFLMMEAPNSKKRKISATVSFVEDKRRVLKALGYYNEENTEKIALRTSLEARFREIVRPADKEGNQSMNVLEVKMTRKILKFILSRVVL